jgi:hypothetical protein
MATVNTKKFSRKDYLKLMRKIKGVTAFAALTGLFFGLLTTRNIIDISYFHIENYLPEHLYPLSDHLWQDSIKGFLLNNLSAFISFFIPAYILGFTFYSKFVNDDDNREIYKRGAQKASPAELKKIILRKSWIR